MVIKMNTDAHMGATKIPLSSGCEPAPGKDIEDIDRWAVLTLSVAV